MTFTVMQAINGFTVQVNDEPDVHVARTAEEVAEIVVKMLAGPGDAPVEPKKARKPRGKNKKRAMPAVNAETLSGLNT